MASDAATGQGWKGTMSEENSDNFSTDTQSMFHESAGTTAAAIKLESSSVGEPWTLAGDSEHSRTNSERGVTNELSDYFIPLEPVKPPVPPNLNVPARLGGDAMETKTTMARHESNGNVVSGDESVGSKEEAAGSEIYVRPDGKKVRKVKRKSFDSNSVDESVSVGSASAGEIYIRPDGKKVRRVKKKKIKSTASAVLGATTELCQLPMAPLEEDEEFGKDFTVEPSDGKQLSLASEKLSPHLESSTYTQSFLPSGESQFMESDKAAQVDLPTGALGKPVELPLKDDKLHPMNEINPWTMEPILDEEASHLSIEATNPFVSPHRTQDFNEPSHDALFPFDAPDQLPPLPDQLQKPLSPATGPVRAEDRAPAVDSVRSLPSEQDRSFSTQSRDQQRTYDSDSSLKVLTSVRMNKKPQPIIVSEDGEGRYDKLDDQNVADSSRQEASSNTNRRSGFQKPLAESIMARTRSRADPNAVVASGRNPRASLTIRVSADDDAFILNTALARKRIRVVQLLIVGLLGFLFGFLGNVYIQSSCHFATAKVAVGTNGQVFRLHYGLWKFTPLDSVFQGYTYCYNYHDRFTGDAPLIPRSAGLLAMMLGAFSLCVVWYYLIFGDADEFYWRWCIRASAAAGILQFMTMFFFVDDVCRHNSCALGPAGIVSLASAVMWLILGFELWYNMPMSAWGRDLGDLVGSPDASLMGNLEMSDFEDGAKAYFRRMRPNHDLPTLNQIQRENENPIGEGMREISVSPRGTYIPPIVDV